MTTNYQNPTSPYVALTQIPYTGFDFGPVGNAIYWFALASFAAGATYLVVYYLPRLFTAKTVVSAPVVAKAVKVSAPVERFEPAKNSDAERGYVGTKDAMSAIPAKHGFGPRLVISRA